MVVRFAVVKGVAAAVCVASGSVVPAVPATFAPTGTCSATDPASSTCTVPPTAPLLAEDPTASAIPDTAPVSDPTTTTDTAGGVSSLTADTATTAAAPTTTSDPATPATTSPPAAVAESPASPDAGTTAPETAATVDPTSEPAAADPGTSTEYEAGYAAGYADGLAAGQVAPGNGGTASSNRSSGSTSSGPVTATSDPGVTAAAKFGWGTPSRSDEFTGGLSQWGLYNGPGHAGKGRRSPGAASIQNGVLTIAGDSSGTTEGMAWGKGAKYGRWEGRVMAPASDPSYNALLLLWPDAENFPVGGEVDFMEMSDPARRKTDMFLHYGTSNSQLHGQVNIDATQWHNWAVEWTPDHIVAFVDGQEWWRTTETKALPPGPMHLTIQLDWFPKGGTVKPSAMHVDWVRYYPLSATG
jgi:hypothetical protein